MATTTAKQESTRESEMSKFLYNVSNTTVTRGGVVLRSSTLTAIFLFSLTLLGCGSGGSSSSDSTQLDAGDSGSDSNLTATQGDSQFVFRETFEDGITSNGWTSVDFNESNYFDVPRFDVIDGRWAAVYHLLGGPEGGNEQTPLNLYKEDFTDWFGASEIDEVYIEHFEYWQPDYDSPTGSQKLIRLGRYLSDDPTGPYFDSWNQIANTNLQIFSYQRTADSLSHESFRNSNRGIPLGRWVRFENWVRLNTPGQADGFCRLYVDGELIASIENADLRGDSDKGFNFLWIGGNATYWQPEESNGHPPYPINNSQRYISGIRILTTKP